MYGTRRIGRDQAGELVGLMDFFCFSEVSYMIATFLLTSPKRGKDFMRIRWCSQHFCIITYI